MTGAVETWPLMKSLDFEVPAEKSYHSMEKDDHGGWGRRWDKTPQMKTPEFAEKVVAKVLKGARGQIWIGGHTLIARLVSKWFPASLSVCLAPLQLVQDLADLTFDQDSRPI